MLNILFNKHESVKLAKVKAKEVRTKANEIADNVQDKELKKLIKKCAKSKAKSIVAKTKLDLYIQKNHPEELQENISASLNNLDTTEIAKDIPVFARKTAYVAQKLGIANSLKAGLAFDIELARMVLSGEIIGAMQLKNNKDFVLETFENIADKISNAKMPVNIGDMCAWFRNDMVIYNASHIMDQVAFL